MPRQGSRNNPAYSIDSDINYLQSQLKVILYCVGLGDLSFDNLSIDLIVEKIRQLFPYTDEGVETAAVFLVKSKNSDLIHNARTLWYFISLAEGKKV
jgi:hypothetical protein